MLTVIVIFMLAAAAVAQGRRQVHTLVKDVTALDYRLGDIEARVEVFKELDAEAAARFELDRHCLEIGVRPSVTAHLGEHLWMPTKAIAVDAPDDGGQHRVTLEVRPGDAVAFDATGNRVPVPPQLSSSFVRVDSATAPPLGAEAWLVFTVVDDGAARVFTPANTTYGPGGFPRHVAEPA